MNRNLPNGPLSVEQILNLDVYECPKCTGQLADMFVTSGDWQVVRLRCIDCDWTTSRNVKPGDSYERRKERTQER